MKIALLFSGQIRDINPRLFNAGLKTLINGTNADAYLTYWDQAGISGCHNIENLFAPKLKGFDVQNYLRTAFDGINVVSERRLKEEKWEQELPSQYVEIYKSPEFSKLTINSLPQLYQIYESARTAVNLQNYDYVFRCRFDSVFVSKIGPELNRNKPEKIYTINFGKAFCPQRVYDIFFYCKPNQIKVFTDPWENLVEFVNSDFNNGLDRRDACRILYLACQKNHFQVETTPIRYCDVYRGSPKYFFDIVKWGVSREFDIRRCFDVLKMLRYI